MFENDIIKKTINGLPLELKKKQNMKLKKKNETDKINGPTHWISYETTPRSLCLPKTIATL